MLGVRAFDLQRVLDVDPEFLDEDAEHQVNTGVGLSERRERVDRARVMPCLFVLTRCDHIWA